VEVKEPGGVLTGRAPWRKWADYHVGGEVSKVLFAPAEWVDRRIRPGYWEYYPAD
jgi:hypothetical protein